MKEIEIICRDNYKLYGYISIPNNDFKYIIYLVHGMCEHKERYTNFIEYLNNKGYATIICDLRGHGYHEDKKNLGYFGSKESLVEDTDEVINYIKKEYPDKKIILFGHSMGSLVVRNYIQNNDSKVDKLIVCGPPTINNLTLVGTLLCNTISLIKGEYYRSKLLYNMSLGGYNKGYELKNEWLVTDKKVIEEYNNDEYCGFIFTINGYRTLFYMLRNAYKNKYRVNNKELPILLIAGSEDRVIVSRKKFEHLFNFLQKQGYNIIDSELFEGMRHELLNEVGKEKVYERIISFVEK